MIREAYAKRSDLQAKSYDVYFEHPNQLFKLTDKKNIQNYNILNVCLFVFINRNICCGYLKISPD